MTCKEWKDGWVAQLYGELDPLEERGLAAHLERCPGCRQALDELRESRDLLRAATPPVPAAPRVVVLGRRSRGWSGAWAFAAGAACALVLFGAGFVIGPRWMGPGALEPQDTSVADAGPIAGPPAQSAAEPATEVVDGQIQALQERLARLEGAPPLAADLLTATTFREELELLERRVNRERVRDLEYVMRSLTASELRTGTWIDQTQDALTLLALKQDPRFAER